MRTAKMCLLAGSACLAVLAFLGAGTASATVLCKANETACSGANTHPAGTTIEASLAPATKFVIAGPLNVECSESNLTAKTTAQAGSPLGAEITALTFGKCMTCPEVKAESLPATSDIEKSGSGNGTFTPQSINLDMKKCYGFTSCKLTVANPKLQFTGGSPAELALKEVPVKLSGFGCGTEGKMSVTYDISKPAPLFVTLGTPTGPSRLCKANQEVCSAGNVLPSGTGFEAKLASGTKAQISGSFGMECSGSSFSGTTSGDSGSPLPAQVKALSFSTCTTCPTQQAQALPYEASFKSTVGGNGEMTIYSPNIKMTGCFGFATCVYTASKVTLEAVGGTPARLIANKAPLTVSGFGCGTSALLTAEYEMTTPNPLWFTV